MAQRDKVSPLLNGDQVIWIGPQPQAKRPHEGANAIDSTGPRIEYPALRFAFLRKHHLVARLFYPMKKSILLFVALSATASLFAGSHKLVKQWETEAVFKTPESVLLDRANHVLYVSNIDGQQPWTADNAGSIGKLGLDGKVIAVEWVKGLQAPKGMGLYQGKLYVADLTEVVVIDIAKGAIVEKIPVAGSQKLNDITIDAHGVVYVSDSGAKRVHRIEAGKASLFLENLKGPNGLLAHDGELYALDSGGLYQVQKDQSLKLLCDGMEPSTDGVEPVKGGGFIVSCWVGTVYFVGADGQKQLLLDTREAKSNTADIGYDPETRITYVPTFFKNTVVAYELQ